MQLKKHQYNSKTHHRTSIRLKNYDYSGAGAYFITICTYNKICLFGHIVNDQMFNNDKGYVVNSCWQAIPTHFPKAELGEFVIMPNHIHGIIILNNTPANNSTMQHTYARGTSQTIGSIIRGFKIGVVKLIKQASNIPHVWQRNYYEHIIRNEVDYYKITEYIKNNPKQWQNDVLYP